MVVCPVCENAQEEASECSVCGRRLPVPPGWLPEVPTLEGLEPTLLPSGGAVEAALIPDLEPTQQGQGSFSEAPPLADMEATRTAPVDVAEDVVPDLERIGDAVPDDGPTPYPDVAVCRYCRTPAAPGERMCSRCGMQLPALGGAAAASAEVVRLCSCGAPMRGSRCPNCGARSS
jgi:hypothetical protein